MADKPIHPRVNLTPSQAAAALGAWLDGPPVVHEVTPMTGGCVDTVLEIVWLDPLELDWVYGDDEEFLDEEYFEIEDSPY